MKTIYSKMSNIEYAIIIGAKGTGNSIKAQKLVQNKKSVWIDAESLVNDDFKKQITRDTEAIVIKNVTQYDQVKDLLNQKRLIVDNCTMKCRYIIITTSELTENDIPTNFNGTLIKKIQ